MKENMLLNQTFYQYSNYSMDFEVGFSSIFQSECTIKCLNRISYKIISMCTKNTLNYGIYWSFKFTQPTVSYFMILGAKFEFSNSA